VHPFLLCNFAGCTKDISRVTHLPGEEPIGYSAQPVLATSGMAPLDACRELSQCYLVNENNPVGRSWLCPCRGWFRLPRPGPVVEGNPARADGNRSQSQPGTAASSNWGAQVSVVLIHEVWRGIWTFVQGVW